METQELFFPPPVVPSRLDSIRMSALRNSMRRSCKRLKGENIPHKIEELPNESPFIKPATLDTVHIVRFVDPWNFHLIIDSSNLANLPKNTDCASFLDIEYDFKNPAQLFRVLTILMSTYVHCMDQQQQKGDDDDIQPNVEYNAGDLVIAVIPRDSDGKDRYFGYRGVIVERMVVATEEDLEIVQCYMVYLLDTGEKRFVSDIFLRVLPHHFVMYPPLAIKCALHGVSPVGPEWTTTATKEVLEAFTTKRDLRFTAEFYSREMDNWEQQPYSVDSFITEDPYFVELFVTTRYGPEDTVNLSELLINKQFALEWTLLPQRPSLRKEVRVNTSDDDAVNWFLKPKPYFVSRNESLLLCKPCPVPIKPFTDKEILLEVARIFHLKGHNLTYTSGMQNVMALEVPDPDQILRKPCGPLLDDDDDDDENSCC